MVPFAVLHVFVNGAVRCVCSSHNRNAQVKRDCEHRGIRVFFCRCLAACTRHHCTCRGFPGFSRQSLPQPLSISLADSGVLRHLAPQTISKAPCLLLRFLLSLTGSIHRGAALHWIQKRPASCGVSDGSRKAARLHAAQGRRCCGNRIGGQELAI